MILLDGASLTLAQLLAVADEGVAGRHWRLTRRCRVDAARVVVDRMAAGSEAVYGINTGFGALAETAIPAAALGALQLNLLRSHAAGVGEPLPVRAVRASMLLRAHVLAKGYSGIRRSTLEQLIELLNRDVHPRVPSRGSVGASGDLAPLAHLALVLVGEGAATVGDGTHVLSGRDALRAVGLEPLTLEAERGAGAHQRHPALDRARGARARRCRPASRGPRISPRRSRLMRFAARSIRSTRASTPRGRIAGQGTSAANIRALLAGSAINRSHEHCGRVQDAYSMRCAAQVHGAARDALALRPATIVDDRGERRDRQPDGVRRQTTTSCREGISMARRWRSPPT